MCLTDLLKEIKANHWEEEVFRFLINDMESEIKENKKKVSTYRCALKSINKINRKTKDHQAINDLSDLNNLED